MKRSRQSKRRLKSIFVMVILTAILSIASTYAWFSANRAVSLTGIVAKVSAAEGLQVSLDGQNWSASVAINEENLIAAQASLTEEETVATTIPYSWPTELTPVSTAGILDAGGSLQFKYGEINATGDELSGVDSEEDSSTTKYISFTMFLKNSSSQPMDELLLNTNSYVQIPTGNENPAENGVQNTGLENSIRSAVVLYDSQAILSASAQDIRALAVGLSPKASIWEPNHNKHILEIVRNDARIAAADADYTTLGLTAAASGTVYEANSASTTFVSSHDGGAITAGSPNTALAPTITVKTAGTLPAPTNLISSADGTTKITLPGNSIVKVKVYIWLEGQDPDCIDTASTGKLINVGINFTKPTPSTGITGLTITPTDAITLSLATSDTANLSASVEPSSASQSVTWAVTSGEAFASIDSTGKVTPLSVGTATITATAADGTTTATKEIRVTD